VNEKLTVVIVIPDLKGNGAEKVMLNLANGLIQKNCDVHIIVFKKFIELPTNTAVLIHSEFV